MTPKWKVRKRSAGYRVDEALGAHFEIVSVSEPGGTVAPIVWSEKSATLMASAPALLESLREAERVLRWAAGESRGRVKAEIVGGWLHHAEQASAVIAKAEGRA